MEAQGEALDLLAWSRILRRNEFLVTPGMSPAAGCAFANLAVGTGVQEHEWKNSDEPRGGVTAFSGHNAVFNERNRYTIYFD